MQAQLSAPLQPPLSRPMAMPMAREKNEVPFLNSVEYMTPEISLDDVIKQINEEMGLSANHFIGARRD